MKTHEQDLVQRCIDRLRELPFVKEAALLPPPGWDVEPFRLNDRGRETLWDGRVRIVTPNATEELAIEAKRTHLTRTIVDGVLAWAARTKPRRPWILFAPHVGRPLARYLDGQGVNFVDLAGNCRLQIGRRHIAKIEGRPPERRPQQGRGTGVPGQQILFALLVQPELLNAPGRTLAKAAGVAPATAAARIVQLRKAGFIHETKGHRQLAVPRRLLDLWINGYETLARPKLLIGRYRTQEMDLEALEHKIEQTLDDKVAWAFGGGAAAHRLTGYYHGPDIVVHVEQPGFDIAKGLRALRAEDGPLILLGAPGPLAFEGAKPRTVAPLLVYTELLFAGDKRARDAAGEIQRKYLANFA